VDKHSRLTVDGCETVEHSLVGRAISIVEERLDSHTVYSFGVLELVLARYGFQVGEKKKSEEYENGNHNSHQESPSSY